jgi:hypothetical protein
MNPPTCSSNLVVEMNDGRAYIGLVEHEHAKECSTTAKIVCRGCIKSYSTQLTLESLVPGGHVCSVSRVVCVTGRLS